MQSDAFIFYEINSSSQAQCTADATKAGEQIAERAHDFDFIGQTAVSINDLRKNGRIKGPSREPFIEDRAFEVLTFLKGTVESVLGGGSVA